MNNPVNKKRVLVTGAAGFLGSHLVKSFLADGHEVLGMDNMQTGSKQNLASIQTSNFNFIEYDVRDQYSHLGRFDIICNLACPAY
jgi:UDP-glucuronate decarboxylase